jgi:hypothetical protein
MKPGMSIGDFALSLIQKNKDEYKHGISSGLPVATPRPDGPDYSNIRVDEDTVTDIFAKSFGIKKKAVSKSIKESQVVAPKKTTKSPEQLIAEFEVVLSQARSLIQEMTSCGMIGVNMAGPVKKKKKLKKWKY